MPARSKAQQRLFGVVHAYNKGEFRGSRSLTNKIRALSARISPDDARHFAKTPHEELPEKKAQVIMGPDTVRDLYDRARPLVYADMLSSRSERRRSFLGRVFRSTVSGAVVGGLGTGVLGAYLANKAVSGNTSMSPSDARAKILKAGLQCGLLGAKGGAVVGGTVGTGLGILDKLRG